MRPLILIYPRDHVFQDVKQESSHLAVRKRDREGNIADSDGNTYFDLYVFDEAYMIKFRELFFDAQAEVCRIVSAWMKDVPDTTEYIEETDFYDAPDFTLTLLLGDDWDFKLAKPVDSKIRQFLIAYILYRWLETKLPEEAGIYFERLTRVGEEIKKVLGTSRRPVRRWTGYW